MDFWSPSEFAMLSDKAFDFLAMMLNMIESGTGRPKVLRHVKGATLAKTEGQSYDPLDFRILMIMPAVYRKWAALRLRQLAPWVSEWALDEMYAGVDAVSAEEAAYLTSVFIEWSSKQLIARSSLRSLVSKTLWVNETCARKP